MILKKKVLNFVAGAVLAMGTLFAAAPSYANEGWGHHGHHHGWHHHGHFHGHGHGRFWGPGAAIAAVGAVVGTAAAIAASSGDGECNQVYYTKNCDYDAAGDRECYRVKHYQPC